MLAFISAQYIRPAFGLFKEIPNSLALLHTFSILVSFSLVVNFLLELTSMAPQSRFKVFRVELVKVFMTVVIFYFLSLWFTTWAQSMAQSVQRTVQWREAKVRKQRDEYNKTRDRMFNQGYKQEDLQQF